VNPLQPLDHRYQRALALHSAGRRPTRQDDTWTRRTLSWIRSRAGEARQRKHEAWMTSLDDAHAVYAANDLPRWHLEARLLTSEPLDEVARRCRLATTTVEIYAEVFWDVRPYLAACDYIYHRALPPRSWLHGLRPDDHASLLKLSALKGGPLALDRTLRVLTLPRAPASGLLDLEALGEACSDLLCRFSLLLDTRPVSEFVGAKLSRLLIVLGALRDLHAGVVALRADAGSLSGVDVASSVRSMHDAVQAMDTWVAAEMRAAA
jgi:hypothetical protein